MQPKLMDVLPKCAPGSATRVQRVHKLRQLQNRLHKPL